MTYLQAIWSRLELQTRLLATIGVVLLAIGIAEPLMQTHRLAGQYRQDMRHQLAATLDGLHLALQEHVITGDYADIEQALRVWTKQSDIEYAEWRGRDARPLRASNPAASSAPAWFIAYTGLASSTNIRELSVGSRAYGELELGISGASWTNRLWNGFTQRLLASTVELVLIFAVIAIVLGSSLGSLSSLVQAARRFRAGHYGERGQFTPGMAPEVREIVEAVNHAADHLAQIMHAVQGASDAISICGLDGKSLFINRAFTRLLGYTLEELNAAGGAAMALAHPTLTETAYPLAKLGQAWSGQIEIKTRDKGTCLVLTKTEPVINEQQEIVGIMTIMTDLTEQQQSARMNERLGRILDDSMNEIYVFDAETLRFVQVNRVACANLGYTLDELRALTAVDIKPHFSREAFESLIAPLREHRVDHLQFVTTHRRKNGTHYPVNAQLQYADIESPAVFYAIIEDITERQNVERWLRESEEKFRSLVESSSDWVWAVDAEYRYTYSSPMVREILGFEPDEIIGRYISDLMPGGGWGRVADLFEQKAQMRAPLNLIENVKQHKHGHRVILETSAAPIFDEQGYLRGYRGIDRDITSRKQVEEALQESMARYRSIVSHIPGMVFQLMLGPSGKLSFPFASEGAKSIFNLDVHALQTDIQHFLDRLDRLDWHVFFGGLSESAGQLTDWQWEGRIDTNGGPRWINLHGSPYQRSDGSIIWDGVMLDVTASKQAQLDVAQSRDQLRELSSYLQTAREDEKAAIARDIHDELGGTLTALKMDAFWLLSKLSAEQETLQQKAQTMLVSIDSAVCATRRIVTELRPTILDDLGLVAAMQWQAREFELRTGITCTLFSPHVEPALDEARAIALFRILQEALTNIAKHARAAEVEVRYESTDDNAVQLIIQDDGCGISTDAMSNPGSHGIRGMMERAHYLRGEVRVGPGSNKGTTISVRLPRVESNDTLIE